VEAATEVPAPADRVFAYLSDLGNHWQLADRWIEVLELGRPPGAPQGAPPDRGRVRMRGPLGVGRTATTAVEAAHPNSSMEGTARMGRGTAARVRWELAARGGVTEVRLSAGIEDAGALDRALLALGGRAWLARRFESVLERLVDRFRASPGG
jgi:polyketide cyclase/dehydrase/lipid transport protein